MAGGGRHAARHLADALRVHASRPVAVGGATALIKLPALFGIGLEQNPETPLALHLQNVILLINLAWSAALYIRFMRGRGAFTALERWQTGYIPVYAAWAALVVIVFPPLFRCI